MGRDVLTSSGGERSAAAGTGHASAHTAWVLRGVLVAALVCALVSGRELSAPTAYATELAGIDGALASAELGEQRLVLLHRRASLTGAPDALSELEEALRDACGAGVAPLLQAQLCLQLHRLPEAAEALSTLPAALRARPEVEGLRADLALQVGRYDDAERISEASLERERGWDALARLAHVSALRGDGARADELYAEAADTLTVREMRAYAWVEVNRGLLDLKAGRLDQAHEHYLRADRAYSGYWLVEEHLAEVLAAERMFEEAAALYRRILARTPRPEIQQALGDLYGFMGQPEEAQPWLDRALAGYLASAERGEVHYYHHLANFYADVRQDGQQALMWASRDLGLRQTYAAHEACAWALFRARRYTEAFDALQQALAFSVEDPHLLFHAALIYDAAGRGKEASGFRERLAALNPGYAETFHVHR
jgi:tetratricopeptide (TPR) repeat protein